MKSRFTRTAHGTPVRFANQFEYCALMIIACPSCATHHQLPDDHETVDGSVIKCATCGHSWLESRAIEVKEITDATDVPFEDLSSKPSLPVILQSPDTEYEAARIAKAAMIAREKQQKARRRKLATIRGWITLAACVIAPVSLAYAFPEAVVRKLPAAIKIYDKIGLNVNIHGLTISSVTHQYVLVSKTRVLAIRGAIKNISTGTNKVPPLRFALFDKAKNEIYSWVLDDISKQPLAPGQTVTFITRVASPPKLADDFQIRFAPTGKNGLYASHENSNHRRPQS